ncbi:MAG: hypothetical protein ACRD88_16680, partial [Terriglobia bacterium]
PEDVVRKADDYHGSAKFTRTTPDMATAGVKSLNLEVPFEEALRLSLALHSCVQALNRYNRSTAQGRDMGALLSIKIENSSISVIEAPMRESNRGRSSDGD